MRSSSLWAGMSNGVPQRAQHADPLCLDGAPHMPPTPTTLYWEVGGHKRGAAKT
jgi:hypothetical protein